MDSLTNLKNEAESWVAHQLPKGFFADFHDMNNRMLVAVTCMQQGKRELAYRIFASLAAEGAQENPNRHFAYVRSLVELAEMDADKGDYPLAAQRMEEALPAYPISMGYMMSRVHLEVYLCYYWFQAGEKEKAHQELKKIIAREKERFDALALEDGINLVTPGLGYAVHQLALLYAEEKDWRMAVNTFLTLHPYAKEVVKDEWDLAEALAEKNEWEVAFQHYASALVYE
ncbi:lipopolysaccharide assembly protein LapB [Mechercharimyces sp. CAU 1602]|uniref:tetratricopeptide repeat protein n=1 Tax=Mechercharimyces sp. CAU 1602 TaxID=2973933 RepID=UPI002162A56B|nr:hypothetical protein [Mechercharimyces sp. CAU 1602]MCS1351902.1 hypothetical protein [Mechercharimyces sp. CAU 1602]